jgi:hypothetical protein
LTPIHEYQHHGSEEKAQSQEDKDGRIGQSVFDQDKGCAPDQGTKDEQKIGFELP